MNTTTTTHKRASEYFTVLDSKACQWRVPSKPAGDSQWEWPIRRCESLFHWQHNPMDSDVVRLDLGRDGESWHRSKPIQRCKLKIIGLCELCTPICITLELVSHNSRNYAAPLFRVVGYNCQFFFVFLRGCTIAQWLRRSLFS